jgi:hypothetical protein
MRYQKTNERRAVILMVVLSLLTLFAIVGITFVLYADAEAAAARVSREAETAQRADIPPEEALAFFLSQLIYDVNDTTGLASGLRGHSLARTMYGYNYPSIPNVNPFNGVGRLHFQNTLGMLDPRSQQQTSVTVDDYQMVNYTWFSGDGFGLRDPERYGTRANSSAALGTYVGGNASYTYPDLNSFFLAAMKADGTVLSPSFHRKWLFNPSNNFNDMTNANWTNAMGKYLTPRPRPAEHPNFPIPDDATGDVKNLVGAPGGNDSIWMDLGAPVMTAPDGTLYKMLFAPLIIDLDGRINLNTAGNIQAYNAAMNAAISASGSAAGWQTASGAHVSNQGWGPWEVNLSKVLWGDQGAWPLPSQQTTQPGLPTPPEWMNLLTGMSNVLPQQTPVNTQPVVQSGLQAPSPLPTNLSAWIVPAASGRYLQNSAPTLPPPASPNPAPTWTPSSITAYLNGNNPSPNGTYPHFYAPVDFNGLNEAAATSASSVPSLPTASTNPQNWYPLFASGYSNGGTAENQYHPLLYNPFQTSANTTAATRAFRESDMEPLLRPNLFNNGPVDANASALTSDLLRLCPTNFINSSSSSIRFRNLVTTLSMDLGVPGVSPYWWNGMSSGYLTANSTNPLLAPLATTIPTQGTQVGFPALTSIYAVSNNPNYPGAPTGFGSPPPSEFSSEFTPSWQAANASTMTYFPGSNTGGPLCPPYLLNPTWTWNSGQWNLSNPTWIATAYTTPGARIRLNRPLPPYPHQGLCVIPAYTSQPTNNTQAPYGVAYNLATQQVANQYQAALFARQALANDIYQRLLAVAGLQPPANAATPTSTELAPRRWLAQLAVNIVDYIDEDDINTPFNFYTTADGLSASSTATTNVGSKQGGDDNSYNPSLPTTGANPVYWVFGTELPKVVLNEVLAEAHDSTINPAPAGGANPDQVLVWAELLNTMPSTAGTGNTQPQDGYRVPLYVTNPSGGGYSPYRITIAQTLMNNLPPGVTPPTSGNPNYLPDASANVLGKAYFGNAYQSTPLPQSTTDTDFSGTIPLSQTLGGTAANQTAFTVPGTGNKINAGVDNPLQPSGPYFLVGPTAPGAPYQNPFASPGLPNNVPVCLSPNMAYTPTMTSWPAVAAGTNPNDERTTGLTVMLRRLANPYLPFNSHPSIPDPSNANNVIPNPVYNPYMTVDSIQNVPIQSNTTPPTGANYCSRGKTQPYAALTQVTVAGKVPQAPSGSVTLAGSPVNNQTANAAPPPTGAALTPGTSVYSTFGHANYPLPSRSKHYDWLVHLDRPPISPIELLHVSAWPPYMLTQRFILGDDTTATNLFGHYAPWFDAPPTGASMVCPWWFDSTLTAGSQSHRLYRLFEFLECGDRAYGVNGLGRIPGKVNINTVWDPEILQALIDANPSMNGITASTWPSSTTPNTADVAVQVFSNLILSRSPNASYNPATGAYSGSVGPVNIGSNNAPFTNTTGDDHPFLPLSAGLISAPSTFNQYAQYPNGINLLTDTIFRTNNTTGSTSAFPTTGGNNWLLFQNYGDTTSTHPYLQTQLLTKLYNNITTRSNTFAVFLTVGFFQVIPGGAVGHPSIPQLGPEIGRSEGRQVRHRMFAILDRTNLSVFTTSGTALPIAAAGNPATTVSGPTPNSTPSTPTTYNPTGTQSIQLPTNVTGGTNSFGQSFLSVPSGTGSGGGIIQAGTQLVIDAGTPLEETVTVTSLTVPPNPQTPATFTANFALAHGAAISIIQRGNPGPWTSTPYDLRNDPLVVRHFSIID